MENETKLNRDQIKAKAENAFEEESQQARDFLETNIDEISRELLRIEVTEEDFHDLFQQEIEKYEEYLNCE